MNGPRVPLPAKSSSQPKKIDIKQTKIPEHPDVIISPTARDNYGNIN